MIHTEILVVILLLAGFALAAQLVYASPDEPVHNQPLAGAADRAAATRHPQLSPDGTWAGVMVILILGGFFLPAAVIGPVAHSLAPPEEQDADAHDDHDSSDHHAHSATSH